MLSWDGAYSLFKLLDARAPFVPHPGREINVVLQAPALALARLTGADIPVIAGVFGAAYAAVPLVALLLTWLVVRAERPAFMFWAVLAILVGMLPGQMLFVSEASIAAQLFWPLLALLLVPPRRWHPLLGLPLGAALYAAHPTAAVLLGFGALVAAARAWRSLAPGERRILGSYAVVLAGLVALKLASTRLSGYETDMLSVARLRESYRAAVAGWPLLALLSLAAATVMSFLTTARWKSIPGGASPAVGRRSTWRGRPHPPELVSGAARDFQAGAAGAGSRPTWERFARPAVAAAVLLAGVFLSLWARDATSWAHALQYRLWFVPVTLAFGTLAAVEALAILPPDPTAWRAWWRWRRGIAQLAALGFAVVLVLQVRGWTRISAQLDEAVGALGEGCSPLQRLDWLSGTPLDHWATVPYVIVRQGRVPGRIVLDGDGCERLRQEGVVALASWDVRPLAEGWFDFSRVAATAPPQPLPALRPFGGPQRLGLVGSGVIVLQPVRRARLRS